jgi:hypothetical protein
MNVPIKYIPKKLTKKDKIKQIKQLKKSRSAYKKGIYIHRKPLDSYKNKKSKHILNAERIYKLKKINVNQNLGKKTGCSIKSLNQIVKKGQGAYYSSGSRPNQTAHSWGIARLASSISGGKAAAVDYNILLEGCNANSKALKLAKKSRIKNGYGTRKVAKINIK